MATGRGFFGELEPISYSHTYDRCTYGSSSVSSGCCQPAVHWFERVAPNTGPTEVPRFVGSCEAHATEYLAQGYEPCERPEGQAPEITLR